MTIFFNQQSRYSRYHYHSLKKRIYCAFFMISFLAAETVFEEKFDTVEASFPGDHYPHWRFFDLNKNGVTAFTDKQALHIVSIKGNEVSYGKAMLLAKHCLKMEVFPEEYSVSLLVGLGGDVVGGVAGQFNPAIEVSRVAIGFYPNYSANNKKGHFFARLVQGFDTIIQGGDMGFIPKYDLLYRVEVKVKKLPKQGEVLFFIVKISNPENEKERFETEFEATIPEELLPIDSLALWRSEGKGLNAIFSDLKITAP